MVSQSRFGIARRRHICGTQRSRWNEPSTTLRIGEREGFLEQPRQERVLRSGCNRSLLLFRSQQQVDRLPRCTCLAEYEFSGDDALRDRCL